MKLTGRERWLVLSFGAVLALALSGCGGISKDRTEYGIRITSEPSGATVYASGKKVGATPLFLRSDTFPTRPVGFIYRSVGTLTLKHTGCKTYNKEVNDKMLSQDMHVVLECGPAYSETPSPEPAPVAVPEEPTKIDGSIERRLRELNALHKEGLITDQEYRVIRKRILDEL